MHEVALGILFTGYSLFLFFFFHLSIDSDCILHGYIKKLGGPFASAWQTRYARLYPNRLELHYESSSTKPELVLMDHIEEINSELTTFKGEQSILLRTKEGGRVVLTNQVINTSLFAFLIDLALNLLFFRWFCSSGWNWFERMAPVTPIRTQVLSRTARQYGPQSWKDLRDGPGFQ